MNSGRKSYVQTLVTSVGVLGWRKEIRGPIAMMELRYYDNSIYAIYVKYAYRQSMINANHVSQMHVRYIAVDARQEGAGKLRSYVA